MPQTANRVSESTTTTGTGTVVLAGAQTEYQSFGDAYGTGGNTDTFYGIRGGGDWEVGIGTYLGATNQLQRDIVLDGTDGPGSKVSFASGTKTVFVPLPADPMLNLRARRATDIPLTIYASGPSQSAALMQFYDNDSEVSLSVDNAGNLKLSPNTNEMLRFPMDTAAAGFIATRRDPLGSVTPGIRYRLSGTGSTGYVQWSQGDTAYIQIRPSEREISSIQDADNTGLKFAQGLIVKSTRARIGAGDMGHVVFDCEGGSAATTWDLGPANNTGSNLHTIRIGRYTTSSASVRLVMVEPGSGTSSVELHSDGYVKAGDLYIGAESDGTPGGYISREGAAILFQAGVNNQTLMSFRDDNDLVALLISPNGTSSPSAQTAITREKGDVRYAAISSLRFKGHVEGAGDLAHLFDKLEPKRWTWGGEVPEGDERLGTAGLGFVAEEVVEIIPEAGRYVEGDGGRVLQGLDPLTLLAVMHAKVSDMDARLSALETRRRK